MDEEQSRYLRFRGLRVHYTLTVPPEKIRDRVLLVCSPLITAFQWRTLIPELTQQGCLTAAVELPGFGACDCGPDVPQDRETRSRILWGIIDALDAEFKAPMSMWHLVAHGSACRTVLHMSALYPESVKSQVFISPLFRIEPPKGDLLALYDYYVDSPQDFADLMELWADASLDDYVTDRLRRPFLRRGAAESFARMLRHLQSEPDEPMGFTPTMEVSGGADPFLTEQTRADIRAMLGEAEHHTLRTAGHLPLETDSEALRDYLRGWLRFNSTPTE